MTKITTISAGACLLVFLMIPACTKKQGMTPMPSIPKTAIQSAVKDLAGRFGNASLSRIEKGVAQVARFWRSEDGSEEAFSEFCKAQFISDPDQLRKTFNRFEQQLESLFGYSNQIRRDFLVPMDLDIGPMLPLDYLFAEYSPDAHSSDDLFRHKIAFVALLNFPLTTLDERLAQGSSWTRETWAQIRLADLFSARVPAEVNRIRTEAQVKADDYISNYNIFMHHILSEDGSRPFPAGMKLLSHWNLRDELKAQYALADGLPRQRMLQLIMEKIVSQDIPAAVVNNPTVDWTLSANAVAVSPVSDVEGFTPAESVDNSREPDTRYERLLGWFRAEKVTDPYYPTMPTLMDRRFQRNREIPEAKVEALFKEVLTSPLIGRTAELIKKRLGRPLESFDVWYNGFRTKSAYVESELDRIVSRKYPNPEAFQKDLPIILRKLGFSPESADFLSSKIIVDPARGSGHASGAAQRVDNARLRTRFGVKGMDYKGYNIAIHEFGHNCEQVFSLNRIDHTMLQGVPNTAFTEAFAYVFQSRDLELLGLALQDPDRESMEALNTFWSTAEISAVSLIDMAIWHWMYEHPDASAAQLRDAVLTIAKDVWNSYFASAFGIRDVSLLAVYSHIVHSGLYLPDYAIGHIIHFQVENYLKGKNLGNEMERMCRLGSITPDLWMEQAVGSPISTRPLLEAAEKALDKMMN